MTPKAQGGMALVLVLAVMSVLLLGGLIGVGMFLGGLRITAHDLAAKRALLCSEAGIHAGRTFFGKNYAHWDAYLSCNGMAEAPCVGYPLMGYADSQGQRLQYSVRILDNLDEPISDPRHDNDLVVILESRCIEPDLPANVIQQLVSLNPSALGSPYMQAGGLQGTNQERRE